MSNSIHPVIDNINDVLPFIRHKEEFRVMEKEGYIAIDYVVTKENTFDSPQARECRGIKFYPDGRIMARPFHKFFNRGERPEEEPEEIEWVTIHEKLDGSMIHPGFDHRGELVFMTRAGRTDVARQAEAHYLKEHAELLADLLREGFTPIFEFTAPENRIVIGYPEPCLTLLAIRTNRSGDYLHDHTLEAFPAPRTFDLDVLSEVKDWVGTEGIVLSWPSGYKLKVKADDYVLKHRTKDSMMHEKNVLALVLSDETDDLANILDPEDYQKLDDYKTLVWQCIESRAHRLGEMVAEFRSLPRKEIAQAFQKYCPSKVEQSICWKILDGTEPRDAIVDAIEKKLSSQSKVDSVRHLIGTKWYY